MSSADIKRISNLPIYEIIEKSLTNNQFFNLYRYKINRYIVWNPEIEWKNKFVQLSRKISYLIYNNISNCEYNKKKIFNRFILKKEKIEYYKSEFFYKNFINSNINIKYFDIDDKNYKNIAVKLFKLYESRLNIKKYEYIRPTLMNILYSLEYIQKRKISSSGILVKHIKSVTDDILIQITQSLTADEAKTKSDCEYLSSLKRIITGINFNNNKSKDIIDFINEIPNLIIEITHILNKYIDSYITFNNYKHIINCSNGELLFIFNYIKDKTSYNITNEEIDTIIKLLMEINSFITPTEFNFENLIYENLKISPGDDDDDTDTTTSSISDVD